ncbi:MAG TPA: type 4a pilus biogenesis protein PilO [Vicinamibacterales bacterium]|nr:type 4a pilus biogenesis protein PilO [Vicinamibacterales bacterium]
MASLGLSKYPWYAQLAVFVLLAGGAAGAFFYFYELPQQQALAVRTAELQAIEGRNAKGQETARQLPAFQAQVADLEARLEALKPILPEEKDVGDLLRRIQTLATQSNLSIRGFRPQPIATKEIHAEWPIGLELEGTYHNLGAFLDRVSRFPRIINVGSLVISSKDNPTPSTSIEVSCTATTFVLVDQVAAPPAAPTKKGAPAKKAAPAQKTE